MTSGRLAECSAIHSSACSGEDVVESSPFKFVQGSSSFNEPGCVAKLRAVLDRSRSTVGLKSTFY